MILFSAQNIRYYFKFIIAFLIYLFVPFFFTIKNTIFLHKILIFFKCKIINLCILYNSKIKGSYFMLFINLKNTAFGHYFFSYIYKDANFIFN